MEDFLGAEGGQEKSPLGLSLARLRHSGSSSHKPAVCYGLRAYSPWGLATTGSVSSHQEPPGILNSTDVWPLWRHCQNLAYSQPKAGTRGQSKQ